MAKAIQISVCGRSLSTAVYTKAGVAMNIVQMAGQNAEEAAPLMQPVNISARGIGNPTLNYAIYLCNSFLGDLAREAGAVLVNDAGRYARGEPLVEERCEKEEDEERKPDESGPRYRPAHYLDERPEEDGLHSALPDGCAPASFRSPLRP